MGTPKCSAFDDLLCVIGPFYRINDRFYSSFLALMQEKKQKKIKVPGAPAKLARYMIDGMEAPGRVFTLLTVRSSGAYGRAGVWGG